MNQPAQQWRQRTPNGDEGAPVLVVTAVQLADQYRHRLPTVQELMDRHDMSRATAYRWRRALRVARCWA